MIITYEVAMAAGRDAGNRRMREGGRTAWNQQDYDHSWDTFNRLYPLAGQIAEQIRECEAVLDRRGL
jgi:hypothetical protein